MPAHFNWIRTGHGHVPEHAVEAGKTASGELLYVGRTYHNGIPCVGKVCPFFEESKLEDIIYANENQRCISFLFDRCREVMVVCTSRLMGRKYRTGSTKSWYNVKSYLRSRLEIYRDDVILLKTIEIFEKKKLLKNGVSINCEKKRFCKNFKAAFYIIFTKKSVRLKHFIHNMYIFYSFVRACVIYTFWKRDINKQLHEQRLLNCIVASIYGGFRELKLD